MSGVPDSCCKIHTAGCGRDVFSENRAVGINRRGCSNLLEEFIERQMTIIEGMAVSIAVLCVISLAVLPATGVTGQQREYQSLQ